MRVITEGLLVLETSQWDAVTGDVGGLVARTMYYLDPTTSGRITRTAPTGVGDFVVQIGRAANATTMDLSPQDPIQL